MLVEELAVQQSAQEPGQFTYRMTVTEYVPPPSPAAPGLDVPGLDLALELEALDFMDMLQLPDLLSVPDFGDPTPPLRSVLDSVGEVLGEAAVILRATVTVAAVLVLMLVPHGVAFPVMVIT